MKQPRLSLEGKTLDEYIIDILDYLREASGLTVAELARRSGLTDSALGKVLRHERALKADEFVRLCFTLRASGTLFLPKELARELAEANYRTLDGKRLLPDGDAGDWMVPHA
ncbi:MAG: helix-turn-helix domain-containing protein [Eggerthellaceae bacterium]|jgi:transcriptional regulator with XRE-family HTH domain